MTIPASNPQTFGWIKNVLNQSMLQAIDALDDVESSDDLFHFETVSKNLHQIQGSLQMVELEAASTLAEDLETLTSVLSKTEDFHSIDQNLEIFRTGLSHLRLYLNAIENQTPQSPLVLIDDINSVRSLIGRSAISTYDLFDPPLELTDSLSEGSLLSFSSEKRKNIIYHLRKRFRQALLAWLTDRDRNRALDVMRDLMSHLHRIGGPEVLQQLWWVAAGFVESIKNAEIEPNSEIKAQFAELDVELSRMREDRLSEIASSPPNDLIRYMLFYIGNSPVVEKPNSELDRTGEIRERLELDRWFSYDVNAAFQDEFAELAEVITALASDVSREDISHLENQIDLFFSGELESEQQVEFFEDLDTLKKITDEENFGPVREFIIAFAEATKSTSSATKDLLQSGADIKIASALLMFENTLRNPDVINARWDESLRDKTEELNRLIIEDYSERQAGKENQQQARAEYGSAKKSVIFEIARHLGEVESFLSESKSEDIDPDSIPSLSRSLSEAANLFGFLEEDSVKSLALDTSLKIKFLSGLELNSNSVDKEQLVFVIASLGVCADMVLREGEQNEQIILRAREVLESIGQPKPEPTVEDTDVTDVFENTDPMGADDPESDENAGELLEFDSVDVSSSVDSEFELQSVVEEDSNLLDEISNPTEASDLLEVIPPTEKLIEDLETVIYNIGENNDQSILSLIEQIDQVRKNIEPFSVDSGELLHLSLLFNAIEDSSSGFNNPDSKNLAAIGSQLVTKIIYREIVLDPEVEDYLGRLSNQLRTIEIDGVETEIDLQQWTTKFNNLYLSNDYDSDDLDEIDTNPNTELLDSEELSDQQAGGLDGELREVFVAELKRHALGLSEISSTLLSMEDENDVVIDMKDHSTAVEHIVHTLMGNFNNVGMETIGQSFESIESHLLIDEASISIAKAYGSTLGHISSGLNQTASDVDKQGKASSETVSVLEQSVEGFKEVNHLLVRSSIPLDINADEVLSNDSDHDFFIEGLDDEESGDYFIEIAAQEVETKEESQPSSLEEERDDFDLELREIFREEAESLLNKISILLTQWRSEGFDEEILAGIRREFHTLKGSAATTGYDDISSLSHVVESLLERNHDGLAENDNTMLNLLEEMHDGVASELGIIPGGGQGHMQSLISMVELLLVNETEAETKIEVVDAEIDLSLDDGQSSNFNVHSLLSFQQAASMEPSLVDERVGDNLEDKLQSTEVASSVVSNLVQEQTPPQIASSQVETSVQQRTPSSAATVSTTVDSQAITMRIDNRKLTDLLNFSGELGLTRTQLKTTLDSTREELTVLRESMKKIRVALRDLEFEADAQMRAMPEGQSGGLDDEDFDPLQMDRYSRLQSRAREVNQQLDDLARIERQLSDKTSDLSGTLVQQYHLGEQLQDGLINARMVSVNEYLPRFRQLVRETARRLGKSVDFSASGGEIEVDRQVMDAMVGPFEHMIRNSVTHGIEDAKDRGELSKPNSGSVNMLVNQQGAELLLEFSDDGRGLNKDKLSKRALELGLVNDVQFVTDDVLLQVITEPGFSTADSVSLEAGRGVGMDVVLQAVRSLGGSMVVRSNAGEGTTFQFRLPVTMTISQALLIRVGSYRFAVLTRSMDRVMRVRNEEILQTNDSDFILLNEQEIPIVNLAERLGETSLSTDESYRSLLLIRLADRMAVFEVDQFEETVEIVTKTPSRQLTSITGITGVTVLADTSIVLILNPEEFLDRQSISTNNAIVSDQVENTVESTEADPNIPVSSVLKSVLVVDDSLVVRKVMQRDLEGLNLDVTVAVDGLNALDILEETEVDIALIDLEMPRMNGYELLIKLRQDDSLKTLPVIVITSRAGELHKNRAMNLGANAYITKPYNLEDLDKIMKSVVLNQATVH